MPLRNFCYATNMVCSERVKCPFFKYSFFGPFQDTNSTKILKILSIKSRSIRFGTQLCILLWKNGIVRALRLSPFCVKLIKEKKRSMKNGLVQLKQCPVSGRKPFVESSFCKKKAEDKWRGSSFAKHTENILPIVLLSVWLTLSKKHSSSQD